MTRITRRRFLRYGLTASGALMLPWATSSTAAMRGF
jgi:hypothetical protein